MQFLYPGFLWALFATAIPIIIHLFNFRRYKTVYFSHTGFLKNIKKETKNRSTLKNLLVLLLRVLAIVFLVMVFAKPYIPTANTPTTLSEIQYAAIYVDNSFSMDAEEGNGALLENAKIKAKEISESFPANTRFLLLTNELYLKHQRFVSRDQLGDWISQINRTHIPRTVNQIIQMAESLWPHSDTNEMHQLFLLSDFQKNGINAEQVNITSNLQVYAVPFSAGSVGNMFIDSVWFESPGHYKGKAEKLFVEIKNISEEDFYDIPIRLFINDTIAASASFTIGSNATQIVELSFSKWNSGVFKGRVEVVDYPITFDNKFYFNFEIADKKQILIVNEAHSPGNFEALFKNDAQITAKVSSVADIPYTALQHFQVIFLNGINDISSGLTGYLKTYVNQGGIVVLNPSIKGNTDSYNAFVQSFISIKLDQYQAQEGAISSIDLNHLLLKNSIEAGTDDARMPLYNGFFPLQIQSSKLVFQTLFATAAGNPLFIEANSGSGYVYLSGLPLTDAATDMAVHPLFVPLFYNMVLFSETQNRYFYWINSAMTLELKAVTTGAGNISMVEDYTGMVFKPRFKMGQNMLKLYPEPEQLTASFYTVNWGEPAIDNVSLNFDRSESELYFYSEKELPGELEKLGIKSVPVLDATNKNLKKFLEEQNSGKSMTGIFLFMALLALIIEMLMLRFK